MKGIKEKNFCEKCKRYTWHLYRGSSKKEKGYTQCIECANKRIL